MIIISTQKEIRKKAKIIGLELHFCYLLAIAGFFDFFIAITSPSIIKLIICLTVFVALYWILYKLQSTKQYDSSLPDEIINN